MELRGHLWVAIEAPGNQRKAVEPLAARKCAGTKEAAGAVWDPMGSRGDQ